MTAEPAPLGPSSLDSGSYLPNSSAAPTASGLLDTLSAGSPPWEVRQKEAGARMVRVLRSLANQAEKEGDKSTAADWFDRANRIEACGTEDKLPRAWECEACHYRWIAVVPKCGVRWCPVCVRKSRRESQERIAGLLAQMREPRFLTLTLPNYPEGQLEAMLTELDRAWERLRASGLWLEYCWGAVASFEVTWNKEARTWHAHLHIVWDGGFMPQQELGKLWHRITRGAGNPAAVHVKRCTDTAGAARYLSKYIGKGLDCEDFDDAALAELVKALWRFRTLRTYGSMIGLTERLELSTWRPRCPCCDGPARPALGISLTLAIADAAERAEPSLANTGPPG